MISQPVIPTEKNVSFNLKTMPPIFRRGQHVLILLKDKQGHYILGKKNMYPEGISRMVGGGMDNDTPPVGACRELEEELGLQVNPDDLEFLLTLKAHITAGEESVEFITHVFFFELHDETLKPASDLDGLATLTEVEYMELVERYGQLPESVDPIKHFAWADYGKVYGPLHQWTLEAVKERSLSKSV